ncbi:MAG: SOS response-associated peptidase [Nocardiopsaceae bacterium]|nr:SOS response-associated peptidase [Nocardiopsaceae bacterium]
MCGRFVSARKRLELLEEFAVERDAVSADRDPDYNVAPTKRIYAVLDGKDEGKPRRELRLVRWGLVPSWAKDASGGARMINARAETVAVKPAFRSAFAKRRCIIPADGYYEWQAAEGKEPKQPFYIHRTDGGILPFAGLYELWRDESLPSDHEQAWLWTASIITTNATDEIGKIHDRTPMVVPSEGWADWLDPANGDKELLLATMRPATGAGIGGLSSYPVSRDVNSVRNNGPDLIAPLSSAVPGPQAGGSEGATLF